MDAAASSQRFARVDEVVYQSGPSSGSRGIRVQVYKHADSDLRVVVCNSSQPLFTVNIYVPTLPPNDKGLPHTLEHLVFCGSKRFPDRGYLDTLANCNLAQGTNAWTARDHTCYTISAASEQAVASVLPAFLDHVLCPLLRDDHFVNEVYHYDDAGREQGVVFSEILGIENDEYELSSFALDRLLYSDGPGYGCSSGGLTRDIATLSNDEIIDYHRRFYDANNVTVVLTGPFSEQFARETLESIPTDIIQSNGCDTRSPVDCPASSTGEARSSRVPFPSPDTDMGSVMVGWRGPPAEDVETLLALDILLGYLAGDPSSPLCQRFVERPCPLANEIDVYTNGYIHAAVTMNFCGIPHPSGGDAAEADGGCDDDCDDDHDHGNYSGGSDCGSVCSHGGEDPDVPHLFDDDYFKDLLLGELRRIHASQFDGDARALEEAAQKHIQRVALEMEDDPSEAINALLCLDIVASHFSPGRQGQFSIGSRAQMFDTMAELGRRPVQFWLDLLEKWLIDAPLYHVVMVPDSELGSKLDDECRAIEQANEAKIADKDAHRQRIAQAVASQAIDLPSELKLAMPQADPLQAVYLPHELSTVAPPSGLGPVSVIQVVKTDTTLPGLRLGIPIDSLPEQLRPYLMLYHGLMLTTDLVLPPGVVYDTEDTPLCAERWVDYTTVDRRLSELTSSSGDSIGLDASEFAYCWIDELYMLTMRVPERNFTVAVRWMLQALVFAEFTAERIIATAQNLLSSLRKLKQDGETMVLAAGIRLGTNCRPDQPGWIERHISLFDQERVLSRIVNAAKADRLDEVVASLDAIRHLLIHSQGGFLALGIHASNDSDRYIAAFAREWDSCISYYAGRPLDNAAAAVPSRFAEHGPFPVARELRAPTLDAPLLVHLPLKAQQASHARLRIATGLCSTPTDGVDFEEELRVLPALDFFALHLLAEILQRTDGPLSEAVRGQGYAYGVGLTAGPWWGTLVLTFHRASDVSRAILAAREVIADMDENWSNYVGDFEVAMARSTMVYNYVAGLSTPENIMLACTENAIEGFASVEQRARWRSVHLAAVTQADLRRVYNKHLRRFLDPAEPVVAVIVTPLDAELLPELGAFERKSLDDVGAYQLP